MLLIKFRKSCKDEYQKKILGLNSQVSQNIYHDICRDYNDIIVCEIKK